MWRTALIPYHNCPQCFDYSCLPIKASVGMTAMQQLGLMARWRCNSSLNCAVKTVLPMTIGPGSLTRRDGVLRTWKLKSSRPRVQVIGFKTGVGREYSFACLAYCKGFCLSNFCLSGSFTFLRSLSTRLRFFLFFCLFFWGGSFFIFFIKV